MVKKLRVLSTLTVCLAVFLPEQTRSTLGPPILGLRFDIATALDEKDKKNLFRNVILL